MGKIAIAILAVLIAGALLYFYQVATSYMKPREGGATTTTSSPLPTATAGAPTATESSTPSTTAATATSTSTPPTRTSESTATNTETNPTTATDFRSYGYEANYTYTITVYIGDMSLKLVGWSVEGVGSLGNYSFSKFVSNIPPRGPVEVSHKAATEGRVMYIITCAGGQCQAKITTAEYTMLHLIHGVNSTSIVRGTCTHLGYIGSAVEMTGRISPEAFAYLLGGLPVNSSGIYVANMCEVSGVPLAVVWNMYLNTTLYGQTLTMKLRIESSAVSVAPYNSTLYQQILAETKAAAQKAEA